MEKSIKEFEQEFKSSIKNISDQANKEFARHRKEVRDLKIKVNALTSYCGKISAGQEVHFGDEHAAAIKEYEGFEGAAKSNGGEIFP